MLADQPRQPPESVQAAQEPPVGSIRPPDQLRTPPTVLPESIQAPVVTDSVGGIGTDGSEARRPSRFLYSPQRRPCIHGLRVCGHDTGQSVKGRSRFYPSEKRRVWRREHDCRSAPDTEMHLLARHRVSA